MNLYDVRIFQRQLGVIVDSVICAESLTIDTGVSCRNKILEVPRHQTAQQFRLDASGSTVLHTPLRAP